MDNIPGEGHPPTDHDDIMDQDALDAKYALERRETEAALAPLIDAAFENHSTLVTTDEAGAQHLELWAVQTVDRKPVATRIELVRTTSEEGTTSTTLSYLTSPERRADPGAWNSHYIFDKDGMHPTKFDDDGTIVKDDTYSGRVSGDIGIKTAAQRWIGNLNGAVEQPPSQPSVGKRVVNWFLELPK
jgi:hypothetical protein